MNPVTQYVLLVALVLVLSAGCTSTVSTATIAVTVKVVHHEKGPGWNYSELLYQVLEPSDLAGRYWVASTRKAAPPSLEGRTFKLQLDSKMLKRLMPGPGLPEEYWSAPPSSKNPDFLKIAEPVP